MKPAAQLGRSVILSVNSLKGESMWAGPYSGHRILSRERILARSVYRARHSKCSARRS